MNYPAYTTTNAPNLARQNLLFAVIVGLVTPREAQRMMKQIDRMPKFKVVFPANHGPTRDVSPV